MRIKLGQKLIDKIRGKKKMTLVAHGLSIMGQNNIINIADSVKVFLGCFGN